MTDRVDIAYPYGFDNRGRTASADYPAHVHQMIEQLLLTLPGERVNRPDFGAGLERHLFGPNSPEIAAAVELSLQTALARWLAEVIEVRTLRVISEGATLKVRIDYLLRDLGETRTEDFEVGSTP
ncbi:GPW/gp25 family protein [Nocardia altamirensis]|uniref:GPW/gp25 family protein n=1 Tax=Nocardia altamirensis TaxID=472158 RepID=UPI00157E1C3A|nr:GPW/gp25 family protein [Nocardia altamirensis]